MDPISAPTLLVEAWKVGGIVLVLILALASVLWFIYRDSRAREERLSKAIDDCQEKHVTIATTTAAALANNTNAMNANTEATKTLCAVMRERPCLKEITPPQGTHLPRL